MARLLPQPGRTPGRFTDGVSKRPIMHLHPIRLILRPTMPHPDLSYLLEGDNGGGIRLELARAAGGHFGD